MSRWAEESHSHPIMFGIVLGLVLSMMTTRVRVARLERHVQELLTMTNNHEPAREQRDDNR